VIERRCVLQYDSHHATMIGRGCRRSLPETDRDICLFCDSLLVDGKVWQAPRWYRYCKVIATGFLCWTAMGELNTEHVC